MSSPWKIAALLAVLIFPLAGTGCHEGGLTLGRAKERPGTPAQHLILVTFENLRADHVSGFGYGPPTTYGVPEDSQRSSRPELDFDALLDLGVGFVRAFSPSPRTHPALASLHYGASPPAVAVFAAGDEPQAQHPALAELLRAKGMTTRAFLSGASGNDLSVFANGFEVFESCSGDMATATAAWDSLTQHRNEEPERPLFLWIHFSEIAPPLDPGSVVSVVSTRDFRNWFDEERVVPATVNGTDLSFGSVEHLDALTRGELSLTEPERRRLISLYDGEISRGTQILRVFLERYAYARPTVGDGGTQWVMGDQPGEEWPNTLLAVCGVQGALLGEECGAWGSAETLSDATLNVPLFLHHPNSFTGRRLFDDIVELQDLAPTLLEVFSAKPPKTMEGRSLLALTDTYAPRSFEARPAFAHLGRERFSLRNSHWRISFDASESEETRDVFPLCADLTALRFYEGAAPLEEERLREDVHPGLRESLEIRLADRIEREVGLKASELLEHAQAPSQR